MLVCEDNVKLGSQLLCNCFLLSVSGCNGGAFHCNKSGLCILSDYKCNGHADCGDGDSSDEELAECSV